jgi:hypothetical protein
MMAQENRQPTVECGRFDAELMAYLEGETRPFVTAHVRECVFCAVVLADLEQVRSLARQMPLAEPSPAVWANVRARLEGEGIFRPKARNWDWLNTLRALANPAPVGALACLAVLGVFLTAAPQALQQPETTASLFSYASPAEVTAPASPVAESQLAHMVADLEATYKANEKFLAPDLRATYAKGLSSLDTSIQECEDSLRKEPANTLAHDYLVSAYSQKAEVLATALEFQGR